MKNTPGRTDFFSHPTQPFALTVPDRPLREVGNAIFTAASQRRRLLLTEHLREESEKAMAPHCSTLAWKIPWTEEPGRLQSIGSLRAGHD